MIQKVTIINQTSSVSFSVGTYICESEVTEIKLVPIAFNGLIVPHYCGYSKKGDMLFSVNCICPCIVENNVKP